MNRFTLPSEMTYKMLSYLPTLDLYDTQYVCKEWYEIVQRIRKLQPIIFNKILDAKIAFLNDIEKKLALKEIRLYKKENGNSQITLNCLQRPFIRGVVSESRNNYSAAAYFYTQSIFRNHFKPEKSVKVLMNLMDVSKSTSDLWSIPNLLEKIFENSNCLTSTSFAMRTLLEHIEPLKGTCLHLLKDKKDMLRICFEELLSSFSLLLSDKWGCGPIAQGERSVTLGLAITNRTPPPPPPDGGVGQ